MGLNKLPALKDSSSSIIPSVPFWTRNWNNEKTVTNWTEKGINGGLAVDAGLLTYGIWTGSLISIVGTLFLAAVLMLVKRHVEKSRDAADLRKNVKKLSHENHKLRSVRKQLSKETEVLHDENLVLKDTSKKNKEQLGRMNHQNAVYKQQNANFKAQILNLQAVGKELKKELSEENDKLKQTREDFESLEERFRALEVRFADDVGKLETEIGELRTVKQELADSLNDTSKRLERSADILDEMVKQKPFTDLSVRQEEFSASLAKFSKRFEEVFSDQALFDKIRMVAEQSEQLNKILLEKVDAEAQVRTLTDVLRDLVNQVAEERRKLAETQIKYDKGLTRLESEVNRLSNVEDQNGNTNTNKLQIAGSNNIPDNAEIAVGDAG